MNENFEPARSVTHAMMRRAALKRFGAGLASVALACFGLMNGALAAPTFTSLDYPGAVFTAADDINNHGQISGWYIDSLGVFHGFVVDNGIYTSIDFPNAEHTSILGINDNGDVVGAYNLKEVGADKDVRGFLFRNGAFTLIDFPGAAETRPIGINRAGDIVGIYSDQKQGKTSWISAARRRFHFD